MKVVYDPEVDVLSVLLSDEAIAESDQDKPGVILDYDAGAIWLVSRFSMLRSVWQIQCPSSTPLLRRSADRPDRFLGRFAIN